MKKTEKERERGMWQEGWLGGEGERGSEKEINDEAEEAEGGRCGVECVDLRIRRASLRIPRWRVYATGHNGICSLPRSSSRSI